MEQSFTRYSYTKNTSLLLFRLFIVLTAKIFAVGVWKMITKVMNLWVFSVKEAKVSYNLLSSIFRTLNFFNALKTKVHVLFSSLNHCYLHNKTKHEDSSNEHKRPFFVQETRHRMNRTQIFDWWQAFKLLKLSWIHKTTKMMNILHIFNTFLHLDVFIPDSCQYV